MFVLPDRCYVFYVIEGSGIGDNMCRNWRNSKRSATDNVLTITYFDSLGVPRLS